MTWTLEGDKNDHVIAKQSYAYLAQYEPGKKYLTNHIRKGTVDNWSSYMNDEQSQRLDAMMAEAFRDMPGLETFLWPQSNREKYGKQ